MVGQLKKIVGKAQREASYWKYTAWTLPFVALAILGFEYWIGSIEWYQKTLIVITVTFFTTSVFWWWWAIHKIIVILEGMNKASENLEDIATQLQETKIVFTETFGPNNAGDR